MSTEINSTLFPSSSILAFHNNQTSAIRQEEIVVQKTPEPQDEVVVSKDRGDSDYENLALKLRDLAKSFNNRLDFSVNQDTGQVIVKVIDESTDKVIRELPPEEVQRLYKRIKDAIGLLFDEVV